MIINRVIAGAATPVEEIEVPFIFNAVRQEFLAFHARSDLQLFMDTYHPENKYEVPKGSLELDTIKQLIADLNNTPSTPTKSNQ